MALTLRRNVQSRPENVNFRSLLLVEVLPLLLKPEEGRSHGVLNDQGLLAVVGVHMRLDLVQLLVLHPGRDRYFSPDLLRQVASGLSSSFLSLTWVSVRATVAPRVGSSILELGSNGHCVQSSDWPRRLPHDIGSCRRELHGASTMDVLHMKLR
eukprot:CAMPEP_0170487308 /NCGR_PEP_ID=MMETSP0208-20121228/6158_1 /TAXON_ID=197538 /ORGANISM="Strombidium inclinatum, Strain S3" /LENGTH=153 /DNA_ID=CAMNT_0010761551 /DNA_START=273 /DNA_END=734 /DNA_ORIENTATION=+